MFPWPPSPFNVLLKFRLTKKGSPSACSSRLRRVWGRKHWFATKMRDFNNHSKHKWDDSLVMGLMAIIVVWSVPAKEKKKTMQIDHTCNNLMIICIPDATFYCKMIWLANKYCQQTLRNLVKWNGYPSAENTTNWVIATESWIWLIPARTWANTYIHPTMSPMSEESHYISTSYFLSANLLLR